MLNTSALSLSHNQMTIIVIVNISFTFFCFFFLFICLSSHQDKRLSGGYENVPTDDIHMNQVL